jgi:hypothetical protein
MLKMELPSMKLTLAAQRTLMALFFAIVAVVYVIAWRAPAMGLYNNDAAVLVSAKALAAGHGFVIDSLPSPVPQTNFPPVFPLLLAAFLKISDQAQWLKTVQLVCTVAWLIVAYRLLRKMSAEHSGALLLVGLTAASPMVVFEATHLLPEPLFAFLVSGALLALIEDRIVPAGALAGLACLTNVMGIPLVAACALTLTVSGRFRRATIFTAIAVIPAAPWYTWAMVHAPNGSVHIAANERALMLGTNLISVFTGPFELLSGKNDLYAAIFTFLLTGWCLWKRRRLVPDLFLLLYAAMLLFWPGPPVQLLAPVLPLIFWLFWRVFRHIRIQEALAAGVLIVALLPLWIDATRLPVALRNGDFPSSAETPNDWKEMTRLFAAIRDNTSPDAVLIAVPDPLFYLNTGRKTIRGYVTNPYSTFYQPSGQAVAPDQLFAALQSNAAGYVALTPNRDFPDSAAFHKSVEALERGGILEPVEVPGLSPEYRLLRRASAAVR